MNAPLDTALGSGLIIEVPEAEPAVGEPRSRLDASARLGVPAHVTVLFPFMAPALIDDAVLHLLKRIFAAVPRFEHRLVRTNWFGDDVLFLAPENEAPFRSLTDLAHREFPDYPPFGGLFGNVIPHLTIADRSPLQEMQSAERRVARQLPIDCVAAGVSLIVQSDATRAWTRSAWFPLGEVPDVD